MAKYDYEDESVQALVRNCIHANVTGVVERILELEGPDADVAEDIRNRREPLCPECGETFPLDAENDDVEDATEDEDDFGLRCPHCRVVVDVDNVDWRDQEVASWHIVDRFLAERLEGYGEVVCYDMYGLVVWGRCGGGQAIYADGVFGKIRRDMDESLAATLAKLG